MEKKNKGVISDIAITTSYTEHAHLTGFIDEVPSTTSRIVAVVIRTESKTATVETKNSIYEIDKEEDYNTIEYFCDSQECEEVFNKAEILFCKVRK